MSVLLCLESTWSEMSVILLVFIGIPSRSHVIKRTKTKILPLVLVLPTKRGTGT